MQTAAGANTLTGVHICGDSDGSRSTKRITGMRCAVVRQRAPAAAAADHLWTAPQVGSNTQPCKPSTRCSLCSTPHMTCHSGCSGYVLQAIHTAPLPKGHTQQNCTPQLTPQPAAGVPPICTAQQGTQLACAPNSGPTNRAAWEGGAPPLLVHSLGRPTHQQLPSADGPTPPHKHSPTT